MARRKLLKMHEELSTNFSFYRSPELGSQCVCPICLKPFDTTNNLSEAYITEAHIIPQAFGGDTITLVCKRCNSSVGSSIESYESNRTKFDNAFSGTGEEYWKAQLSPINGENDTKLGKATVEATFIEDRNRPTFIFKVIPNASSPKALDAIEEAMKTSGSIRVETQVRGGWNRGKLTYLHAAYLFLFKQLGYEWVLAPHTQILRDQIQKPEEELIVFQLIQIHQSELSVTTELATSWYMITQPIEAVGFLIVFSGLQHFNSPVGVWMPFPGCCYKQMSGVSALTLEALPIFEEHLSDVEFVYPAIRLLLQYFFD